MILVRLNGGLGNQLFQYSFGRYLSLKNNSTLFLDTTHLESDHLRKYELSSFLIQAQLVDPKLINITKHAWQYPFKSAFSKLQGKHTFLRLLEAHPHTYKKIPLRTYGNICLEGYWQCWQIPNEIITHLHRELACQISLSPKAKDFFDKIKSTNSISIHFRRGDYIADPHINLVHGTCSLAYYKSALNLMLSKVSDPHLFIFSDDIPWVKSHLKLDAPTFYEDQVGTAKAVETLYFMQHCRHNIIANSSFSWWGAFLNQNPSKIIIAPACWYSNGAATPDLLAPAWIQL